MKKVVIFGAAGHIGKYLTRKMMKTPDIELTVFIRDPAKFGEMDMTGVNVIKGDVLRMAENIVKALDETSVRRIIWITGMGIHHEIKGLRGMMLDQLAKQRPEYIKAADAIASSPCPSRHFCAVREYRTETTRNMSLPKRAFSRRAATSTAPQSPSAWRI